MIPTNYYGFSSLNRLTRKDFPFGNEQKRKTPAGLDCPIVLLDEFVTVDDGNVCTVLFLQRHFGVCSKLKNIIDADSDDENEMNYVAPVLTSSYMRNLMKSMHSYLDAYSNGKRIKNGLYR
ncbi:hypothetical protein TNCV_1881801 [Trichonephila clavipes]|nr:hypothetical protein TNCV_1881801 [Trichonephila clavipes]